MIYFCSFTQNYFLQSDHVPGLRTQTGKASSSGSLWFHYTDKQIYLWIQNVNWHKWKTPEAITINGGFDLDWGAIPYNLCMCVCVCVVLCSSNGGTSFKIRHLIWDLKADQELVKEKNKRSSLPAKGTRYMQVSRQDRTQWLGGPERRTLCQENPAGKHRGMSQASHLMWPDEGCGFSQGAPRPVFLSYP